MIRLHGFIDRLEQLVSADQLMQPFEIAVREDMSVKDATGLLCDDVGFASHGFGIVRDHFDHPVGIFSIADLDLIRDIASSHGTGINRDEELNNMGELDYPISEATFLFPASSAQAVRRSTDFRSVLRHFGEFPERDQEEPGAAEALVVKDAEKLIGYISIAELLSGPAALLLFAHVRELEAAAVELCTAYPSLWNRLKPNRKKKTIARYETVFASRATQVRDDLREVSETCQSEEKQSELGRWREYIQATELCDKKEMLKGDWSLSVGRKPSNTLIGSVFECAEKIRNFVAHPVSTYMFDQRVAWQYIFMDDGREMAGDTHEHSAVAVNTATPLEELTPRRIARFLEESGHLLEAIDSELNSLSS